MYIPSHFVNPDRAESLSFMKQHPFGLLVSGGNHRPTATHLPFIFAEADGKLYLNSHLAALNEQALQLLSGEVLVVFSAPHAYISPSLYKRKENVPTWNYISVHCYGSAHIIEGEAGKRKLLEEMISHYEPKYMEQWKGLSGKYVQGLLGELVAFRIEVTEMQAASKVSQNKSADERENIAAHLSEHGDAAARELAEYMRQRSRQKDL